MPYLKFDSPSGSSNNKGSCDTYVNYLTKEDFTENPYSKEFFFNHESNEILNYQVIEVIDNNRKGLAKNDAKFYSGSINFSEQELQFLGNDSNRIKEYCIKVMEQYASNFNRGVSIDNINWFGKIEYKRYFKGDDEEVINGIVTQGEIKPGLNTHVHFIVGRKSKDQKLKLSPKTNHRDTQKGPIKGGFNRDEFKMQSEKIFDEMFGYLRPLEESYQFYKIQANGTIEDQAIITNQYANEKVKKESYANQSVDKKENRISKLANFICHGTDRENIKHLNIDEIIRFEQTSGHKGYVYRSLINLNRMIRQGKTPTEYDLTDRILGYAKYLEYRDDKHNQHQITKKDFSKSQNPIELKVLYENHFKKKSTQKVPSPLSSSYKRMNITNFDWLEYYGY